MIINVSSDYDELYLESDTEIKIIKRPNEYGAPKQIDSVGHFTIYELPKLKYKIQIKAKDGAELSYYKNWRDSVLFGAENIPSYELAFERMVDYLPNNPSMVFRIVEE